MMEHTDTPEEMPVSTPATGTSVDTQVCMQTSQVAPVRVAVTGGAGQIGYSLLFRIASGAMLGVHQPVILQLLEIPAAMDALRGVAMELDDCAFRLLAGVELSDDPDVVFANADAAILVGSRPRTQGMARKDLLEANGAIFTIQGRALSKHASPDVRVLVVGNPANTNCFIAMRNAPDIPRENFTAMTRLDHNRAQSQLAAKLKVPVDAITRMAIWGNHSATQYPDLFRCKVNGRNAVDVLNDSNWIVNTFIPGVQNRGSEIIKARGASSAASAANAAIDHMRDWMLGMSGAVLSASCATPGGDSDCELPGGDDWVSMAVPSDGSYDVPEGVVSSFPVQCVRGHYSIVRDLDIDSFSRDRIEASVAELISERDTVDALGLV